MVLPLPIAPAPLPLVPAPALARAGKGHLPLADVTHVVGDFPAALHLIDAVAGRTGIRLAPTRVDDDADAASAGTVGIGTIALRIDRTLGNDEGYTLVVDDRISIAGGSEAGLFYGVQTLLQLLREDDAGWGFLRAQIADAPRFERRGLMLDVARHFFGVDDVKKLIDSASALKLNHLHLHLSDDQGWRIEIESWPRLTAVASSTAANGDPGGFYSKEDYREIIRHAAARHMIVIPEIDLPGHTHALGIAYPDLVEAPVLNDGLVAQAAELGQALPAAGEPYLGWGVGHSSVRIHDDRTYDLVRDVVRELAEMTPGPYIHIGGDEALGTPQADFDLFIERVTAIVAAEGRTPIAWHEAGSAADLARGTVGQYWGMTSPQGAQARQAAHFVERGGRVIASPADAAYLDMKPTPDFPVGLTWAAASVDVRRAYEWEPTTVLGLAEESILGVEAPLWSETTRTFDEVEQLVFPRAAAVAEIAWSPSAGDERSWESFRERLGGMAPLWKAAGVDYHPADEIPWSTR